MSGWTVEIDDQAVVAAFTKAPALIGAAMHRTIELGAVDFEGSVVSHTPVFTGALRQSITHTVSGSGIMVEGKIFSSDSPVKVASVETGRSPGRPPPISNIESWVNRKLGIGGAEGRSVAFLIARSIGRRGTKPGAGMFRKGFDSGMGRWNARVAELMRVVKSVL